MGFFEGTNVAYLKIPTPADCKAVISLHSTQVIPNTCHKEFRVGCRLQAGISLAPNTQHLCITETLLHLYDKVMTSLARPNYSTNG